MKKFKIVYVKQQSIFSQSKGPVNLAEVIVNTDKDVLDIPVPAGFQIMTICEILPDVTILKSDTDVKEN